MKPSPVFKRLLAAALLAVAPALCLAGPGTGLPLPPPVAGLLPGPMPLPPLLHGLQLSDEQQDKIFDLLHAAAPTLRDRVKARQRAADDLQAAALSEGVDEARLQALGEALGRAGAGLALVQARLDRQLFAVLTAEQRRQVAERPRRPSFPQ